MTLKHAPKDDNRQTRLHGTPVHAICEVPCASKGFLMFGHHVRGQLIFFRQHAIGHGCRKMISTGGGGGGGGGGDPFILLHMMLK